MTLEAAVKILLHYTQLSNGVTISNIIFCVTGVWARTFQPVISLASRARSGA